ncbi:MAG: helix-turn-helix domain-containing protein [Solirubrobacterales bacterium]|nr:helix-turn-helix domain-containing protein [Solirubrobacterales bacterium]
MTPGFDNLQTDDAVLHELGQRIARIRIERDIAQNDLAREAGVGRDTVAAIEAGRSVQSRNLIRVLRALRMIDNLEVAVPAPQPSPLKMLEDAVGERKRAKRSDSTR